MRLRTARRDGALQSADAAELESLRKEFDQSQQGRLRKGFDPRKARTFLDGFDQLGYFSRSGRGAPASEDLLVSELNKALEDGTLPPIYNSEFHILSEAMRSLAAETDVGNASVELDQ